MAFLPLAVACFFAPLFQPGGSATAKAGVVLQAIGAVAVLMLLSFAAYGFLELRKRVKTRQPSAHGEGLHYKKRRPSAAHRPEKDDDEDAG